MRIMNTQKLALYGLCLGFGGAIAVLVGSTTKPQAHASHSTPESLLPSGTVLHECVATLSKQLEEGTIRLQDILEATTVMLAGLRADRSESAEEIKLPLVDDEATVGYLRMPEAQADGTRQWIFEVTIDALPHHSAIANYTDVIITYSGVGAAITSVSASSDTSVHRRASTVEAIGSRTYVTGGWFFADASASKTCPLVLTVSAENPQRHTWRSSTGERAQGGDVLTPANYGSVAGILLSL